MTTVLPLILAVFRTAADEAGLELAVAGVLAGVLAGVVNGWLLFPADVGAELPHAVTIARTATSPAGASHLLDTDFPRQLRPAARYAPDTSSATVPAEVPPETQAAVMNRAASRP
ncbi:MAG: hypothetical protein ACRDNZ_21635 [Streptosporangiaceae bacterium]